MAPRAPCLGLHLTSASQWRLVTPPLGSVFQRGKEKQQKRPQWPSGLGHVATGGGSGAGTCSSSWNNTVGGLSTRKTRVRWTGQEEGLPQSRDTNTQRAKREPSRGGHALRGRRGRDWKTRRSCSGPG